MNSLRSVRGVSTRVQQISLQLELKSEVTIREAGAEGKTRYIVVLSSVQS